MPFVRRTRATLRSAEFGFFGVWVKTRTHTPRFCGLFCSALFACYDLRPTAATSDYMRTKNNSMLPKWRAL